ncbi:hypothetical protein RvY_11586 [Ramazzottius varieornatus]|uniref:Uncharacterized protein n=1 Tax=Ramazzottius varieornatus TaxID=947166 RepID=A0A1D1VJ09_RAMVA|nr:hypothetical protein RvY_11586 [Ramazzottius varieornatus]
MPSQTAFDITIFFVTSTPFAFCLTHVMTDWSKFYDQLTVPLPSLSLGYKFVLKYGQPVSLPAAFKLGSLLLATAIIQRYLRLQFQELSVEPFELLLQGLNNTTATSSGDVVTSSLIASTVPDSSTWEKAWNVFIKTYGPYVDYCMVLCGLSELMTLGYRTWKKGCEIPAYRAPNMATKARVIHAIAICLNAMDWYEVATSTDTGGASITSDLEAFDGGSFVNLRMIGESYAEKAPYIFCISLPTQQ